MHSNHVVIAALLFVSIPTSPTSAGVVDSPLPLLDGRSSKHVFTVPGVLQHSGLATTFICTSLERKNDLRFFVEIFPAGGGERENTLSFLVLSPGESAAWTIGGTTYSETLDIVPDSVSPRSARIIATSTKLACTAVVLERQGNGALPTVAWNLSVIKKTSQKGD